MKIGGFLEQSLIDYPGKISAIVFTRGCNLRCPFCHNPDLISSSGEDVISEHDFFDFLKKRKGLLDAVTITGGEPTLQHDLPDFIKKVKQKGFAVKLDTNGTNPQILGDIISEGLASYIAMDIKNSLEKYHLAGKVDTGAIQKSIGIIMQSGVPYEFRTTVLPRLHSEKDMEEIGKLINGADKYFIQNFRPENTLDANFKKERGFTPEELNSLQAVMKKYVKACLIRENI